MFSSAGKGCFPSFVFPPGTCAATSRRLNPLIHFFSFYFPVTLGLVFGSQKRVMGKIHVDNHMEKQGNVCLEEEPEAGNQPPGELRRGSRAGPGGHAGPAPGREPLSSSD